MGVPSRSFDRLLNIHAEIDHIDQGLYCNHDLVIAARTSGNHERLTVLHHQCALQRATRSFSGFQRVGLAPDQRVIVTPAIEDNPRVSHHDSSPEDVMKAGLEAHYVSVLVD